jgi:integrase
VASIRTNKLSGGRESFTLQWREQGEQRGLTFDNRPEAERWKRLLDANGQSFAAAEQVYDASTAEGPTLAEAMADHIDNLVGTTPYTLKRYRESLRLHFNGPLGHMKVKAITHDSIIQWIKWMQARDLSPKTIANKHGLLSATFETCIRRGLIERNPCKGVRLPKKVRVGDDGDDITMDDYRAIRARMDAHFHPFIDFLVGTGCRFSEATALVGKDFQLDHKPPLVFISKAHKLGGEGEGRYIGEPKSRKSRRRVSLAPSTVAAVRPLVDAAGPDGPVFKMKRGGEFSAQAFFNHAWQPARKAAGLEHGEKHVTVHSLRHLHASILVHQGLPLYEVSARLGHTSIQITADLYAGFMPDAHFVAAEHAARALGEVPALDEIEEESA